MEKIICPKCFHEQDSSEECVKCGIVFSEYQTREASKMGQKRITVNSIWGMLGKTALVVVGLGVVLGVVFYAIILPNFLRHGLGYDPPREAKTNLSSLFTSQITYYGEEDTYASSIENLGWIPYGLKMESWWEERWGLSPDAKTLYSYTIVDADSTHFIARAEGNIDDDPTLDVWEINAKRELTNVVNDILG